jgi:hypothetical protein
VRVTVVEGDLLDQPVGSIDAALGVTFVRHRK